MNSEEIAVTLEGHSHEIGSLKHRMNDVEKGQEALTKLATSVEVIASELKNQSNTMKDIKKDVTALGSKVDAIENKPAKRWEGLVERATWAIAAAVIAFLLGRVGL